MEEENDGRRTGKETRRFGLNSSLGLVRRFTQLRLLLLARQPLLPWLAGNLIQTLVRRRGLNRSRTLQTDHPHTTSTIPVHFPSRASPITIITIYSLNASPSVVEVPKVIDIAFSSGQTRLSGHFFHFPALGESRAIPPLLLHLPPRLARLVRC